MVSLCDLYNLHGPRLLVPDDRVWAVYEYSKMPSRHVLEEHFTSPVLINLWMERAECNFSSSLFLARRQANMHPLCIRPLQTPKMHRLLFFFFFFFFFLFFLLCMSWVRYPVTFHSLLFAVLVVCRWCTSQGYSRPRLALRTVTKINKNRGWRKEEATLHIHPCFGWLLHLREKNEEERKILLLFGWVTNEWYVSNWRSKAETHEYGDEMSKIGQTALAD